MNRNAGIVLFLVLVLANVFAVSSITSFSINSGNLDTTSTSVTLNYAISADANCGVCFSENSESTSCSARNSCSATTSSFTLSSANGTKTVYAFVFDDNNLSKTESDTINLDNTPPSCSITSPTGDFNSTSGKNFVYSCNGASNVRASINGITVSTNSSADSNALTWLTANTTYTALVDANDSLGNNSQTTFTFKYDTTAPSFSFTTNEATNDDTPDLNFSTGESSTAGWKIILSCDDQSHWTSEKTYASVINDFDITSSAPGCNLESGESGKIYAKVRDAAGNWSSADSEIVLYDEEDPNFDDSDFDVTAGDKEIIITWNDPDKDYELTTVKALVYQNGSLKKTKSEAADEEEIIVTGLNNGYEYDVYLELTDKAGNEITIKYESLIPRGITAEISLDPQVNYIKSGDRITAKCSFSDDSTGDAYLEYKYTYPNTNKEELDNDNDTTSLSGTITVTSATHEGIYFYCRSDESSNDEVYVRIDNNSPTIEWKDTNNLFVGIKRIVVKASDNIFLSTVEIDFNNTTRTVTSRDFNNNYYYDINSQQFPNGNYTLKATATDGAGNKTEITRTVTLDNYMSPKQLAEKTINSAKEKQKVAIDLVNYYKEQALIIPTELGEKKNNADALLMSAENKFSSGLYEDAKSDANNAVKLFDEFSTSATTQVKQTLNYTTNDAGASEILQKYGLTQEEALNQINLMKDAGILRKLLIVQSGTSNNRQIKIEISFTNDTNSDIVKIIEVIPKELVESAKSIVSDENFRIIKDDPVIEFTVPVAKGASATISYGIGEVTSIKADELVSRNIIDTFETSPIMLEGTITTEEQMKNLNGSGEFTLIAIGVVIIIILLIAIIFIAKFKNPGHGFGEEKTLFEHATAKENPEPKKKFEAFK